MTDEGELLWEPGADTVRRARVTTFAQWLADNGGPDTDGYTQLWQWSVDEVDAFWSAFTRWYGVRWRHPASATLADDRMPGASWFPDARLNYAEHALYPPAVDGVEVDPGDPAVVFAREDGLTSTLSWGDLRRQVGSVRTMLVELGVVAGDRVAALVPNTPEALVAMLATCSIGAIWSSCSPDFGPRAVADRFTQIEPVVLFAVDGYRYGGKAFDVRPTVDAVRAELVGLRATCLIPYLDDSASLDGSIVWADAVSRGGEPAFEALPFDAPLWILYSSGTTGLPKPIVHCHGGILVEHAKQLALHLDIGRGDRFFWFSTTGWMMWNLLVSGLVVGSTVVLFDGNPAHPGPDALWRLVQDAGITCFGVSAPYLQACMAAGVRPGSDLHLSALRSVGSTGSPLPPEGFAWVYAEVKRDLLLASVSGGTDVCTAFVGAVPTLPVRAGEIPCRALGCAVESFDAVGRTVVDEVGELVITRPMPSMPVAFWNDADGSRMREAYYETYPGVWRHGDWIKITGSGSCVIYGRSDSTLNRGGVRMGTSEFYRVVEQVPGVADSLVIDTSGPGSDGRLLLFLMLADDTTLEDVRDEVRVRIRRDLSLRHVPDEMIAVDEIPRTLNGKKCEVPVKRVLAGTPLRDAVSEGALRNPDAMRFFVGLAGR